MSDLSTDTGEEVTPVEEEEVQAPETEVVPEPESDPVDTDEQESEEEDTEEGEEEIVEEIEFNFGGKKISFAKNAGVEDVAEKLQTYAKTIEAHHTQRSQAVAETSKSLEAREAAIQKLEGLHGETLETYSKGLAQRQRLEALQQQQKEHPDLWQTDPDQARMLSDELSKTQADFQQTIQEVSQRENALTQAQHAEMKRRMDEGKKNIETRIKGFEAKAPEVVEYVVKNYGVPQKEADNWAINPAGAEMAYKAMMYDQMQAKVKKTIIKKPAAEVPVKAMKAKGGKHAKDPSKMSADEYRHWFTQQKRRAG